MTPAALSRTWRRGPCVAAALAVAVAAVLACGGGSKSRRNGVGVTRPGVIPMLSELPGDPTKRDAILDSANQVAGPEHRKGMSPRARKVETIAATAAAIIGRMLSKTPNVTLGRVTQFDENQLVRPSAPPPPRPPGAGSAAPPPVDAPPAGALVPWIKLEGSAAPPAAPAP